MKHLNDEMDNIASQIEQLTGEKVDHHKDLEEVFVHASENQKLPVDKRAQLMRLAIQWAVMDCLHWHEKEQENNDADNRGRRGRDRQDDDYRGRGGLNDARRTGRY